THATLHVCFPHSFFFYCYGDHRALHSFPTRRSSDLLGISGHAAPLNLSGPIRAIRWAGLLSNVASSLMRLASCRRARESFLRNRSEEHTSELQSLRHLVCRLLLEKKKI